MADAIIVDERLSTSSTNPVQNKVVTAALNTKVAKTDYAAQGKFGIAKIWVDSDRFLNIVTTDSYSS